MATKRLSGLPIADPLVGDELVLISRLSAAIAVTGTTVSAAASDNSYNDSANGFVTAGFQVGDRVSVSGFATGANNLRVAVVTAVVAGKLTIGGADGDAIADEAAGPSVTISKWISEATTVSEVGGAAGGATEFVGLTDVPASYDGAGGYVVRVKGDLTGLEFVPTGTAISDGVYANSTKYRLVVTAAGAGGECRIGELELYDVDGITLGLNGATMTASTERVGFEAEKAADLFFLSDNCWRPTAGNEVGAWLQGEFVSARTARSFKITPDPANFDDTPTAFGMEVWVEALLDWVNIGSFSTTWPDDADQTFTLDPLPASGGPIADDAPIDSLTYGRRNGTWTQSVDNDATLGGGTPSAFRAPSQAAVQEYVANNRPPFTLGWGFQTPPTSGTTIAFMYVFAEAVDFADDWAGSVAAALTNPTADYDMTVYKNGVSAGSASISTAGADTFVTTAGAISFAIGDTLHVEIGTDATLANVAVTFKGTRV